MGVVAWVLLKFRWVFEWLALIVIRAGRHLVQQFVQALQDLVVLRRQAVKRVRPPLLHALLEAHQLMAQFFPELLMGGSCHLNRFFRTAQPSVKVLGKVVQLP